MTKICSELSLIFTKIIKILVIDPMCLNNSIIIFHIHNIKYINSNFKTAMQRKAYHFLISFENP